MLGWWICAQRLPEEELRAARCDLKTMVDLITQRTGCREVPRASDHHLRLAVWQTGLGGTDWLDGLAVSGRAATTMHSGYPESYLLRFRDLQWLLDHGLLSPAVPWRSAPGDTFGPGYLGTDTSYPEAIAATAPDEWILVEAWDES
jgi:hypothetical protein